MKYIYLIVLSIICTVVDAQTLSSYGSIQSMDHNDTHTVVNVNGILHVNYKDALYPGNTLILHTSGFVVIDNTCGNTASILRFYTSDGESRHTMEFPQTILPRMNGSGRYLQFQNSSKYCVLDTETMDYREFGTSTIAVRSDGLVAAWYEDSKELCTPETTITLDFVPHEMQYCQQGHLYVFGKKSFGILDRGRWKKKHYQEGHFGASRMIDGRLYWTERLAEGELYTYSLLTNEGQDISRIAHKTLDIGAISVQDLPLSRGAGIVSPMFPDSVDYPFPIGNSYGEHQRYGIRSYLHPGVDILGVPDQKVFSPVDGVVRAVLTTSGTLHWRVAISQTATEEEQEGYLFAHLKEESIPFSVGDTVKAGQYLGTLVAWPAYDFHHLHFARIRHSGVVWDGTWTTIDNVLQDITNFRDSSPPVFEPLWEEETIAFRAEGGVEILESDSLYGSFDIVCHVHDISNSDWKIDVHSIGFDIRKADSGEEVYRQEPLTFDFDLDFYGKNEMTQTIMSTIYSLSPPWTTLGNYNTRSFYQILSRSNRDGVIDALDEEEYFDSRILDDGAYIIKVCAEDAKANTSCTEQSIHIKNKRPTAVVDPKNESLLVWQDLPGVLSIRVMDARISKLKLVDISGRIVCFLDMNVDALHTWDVPTSGVYSIQAYGTNDVLLKTYKMMLGR